MTRHVQPGLVRLQQRTHIASHLPHRSFQFHPSPRQHTLDLRRQRTIPLQPIQQRHTNLLRLLRQHIKLRQHRPRRRNQRINVLRIHRILQLLRHLRSHPLRRRRNALELVPHPRRRILPELYNVIPRALDSQLHFLQQPQHPSPRSRHVLESLQQPSLPLRQQPGDNRLVHALLERLRPRIPVLIRKQFHQQFLRLRVHLRIQRHRKQPPHRRLQQFLNRLPPSHQHILIYQFIKGPQQLANLIRRQTRQAQLVQSSLRPEIKIRILRSQCPATMLHRQHQQAARLLLEILETPRPSLPHHRIIQIHHVKPPGLRMHPEPIIIPRKPFTVLRHRNPSRIPAVPHVKRLLREVMLLPDRETLRLVLKPSHQMQHRPRVILLRSRLQVHRRILEERQIQLRSNVQPPHLPRRRRRMVEIRIPHRRRRPSFLARPSHVQIRRQLQSRHHRRIGCLILSRLQLPARQKP